jgi:SAM-dependent methyltransferase
MIATLRFGEESIDKIVEWVAHNVPLDPTPTVLEIGSGNGTLLFALQAELQPPPYLFGIDYSSDAVGLSRSIAEARGGSATGIHFEVCDFLKEVVPEPIFLGRPASLAWDLVLDKGTLDAIALGNKDEEGRSPASAYPSKLVALLRPGSFFLVTSEFMLSAATPRLTIQSRLQLHGAGAAFAI